MSITSILLERAVINTTVYLKSIESFRGLAVEFFYPIIDKSIYGTDDADLSYDPTPSKTGKYVVTGVFTKRFKSDVSLDLFGGDEPKLFLTEDVLIPEDTKVVVYLNVDEFFVWRATLQEVYYGNDKPTVIGDPHGDSRKKVILQVIKLVPIQ